MSEYSSMYIWAVGGVYLHSGGDYGAKCLVKCKSDM